MTDIAEALVAENRRLQREVRDLRDRLAALERSRWHRLNPRRLLPKRPDSEGETPSTPTATSATVPTADGNALERFTNEVVERGTFTEHWFTRLAGRWEPMLAELEGRSARVLEIGSFEGLSACFVLWRLRDATVTCVDTFEGGVEQVGEDLAGLEQRFDENVALVNASRVRKIVGDSRRALLDLAAEEARFDLVYIDGSHMGLDVLVDAALSWQLLEAGGFLVFDDYRWAQLGDDPLLRPGVAVDLFVRLVEGKHVTLFRDRQYGVRKVTESRDAAAPSPRESNAHRDSSDDYS